MKGAQEKGGERDKVTRRDIFFVASLAFFGLIILMGIFLWRESALSSKELEFNREAYAKQLEELQKEADDAKASQATPGKNQPAKTPSNAEKAEIAQNQPSKPAPAAAAKGSVIVPGSKVGDIIKMGDVEMIVTQASARHKVIEINLKGNTSIQAPKLLVSENNRIVYEIPADVDVNVNITEKISVEKSPLFYKNQEQQTVK